MFILQNTDVMIVDVVPMLDAELFIKMLMMLMLFMMMNRVC